MARLQLTGITKRYGDFKAADDVSLDIADGEFLVLLGPSGCGKTTTLRIVAGFVEPTSGRVRLGERDITALPPWKRNTGLVFQSYALFPHMTVAENIAFGLEMRQMPKTEMAPKITEALRLVRLDHLSDRLPRQLSGGQQQRVALARALVFRPDVLLLDEPLSNLDAKLRQDVRVEIRDNASSVDPRGLTIGIDHGRPPVVMSDSWSARSGQQDLTSVRRKDSSPISSGARPSSMAAWTALGVLSRPAAWSSPAKEAAPATPRSRYARNVWR
jgi:ABC-type Fe3+/spermidine/putrescine transport system ATPase subunit